LPYPTPKEKLKFPLVRPNHLLIALVGSIVLNVQLAGADEMITRVFDVGEVLTGTALAPPRPPQQNTLLNRIGMTPAKLPPAMCHDYEMKTSELIDVFYRFVTPDVWNHNAHVGRFGEDNLVVYAPLKTQKAIVALLDNLRHLKLQSDIKARIRISVETRFVTITAAALKSAGITIHQTRPSQDSKPIFLSDAQIAEIAKASASQVYAPRATLRNGQGAAMYRITFMPYVGSVDVETSNGKTVITPKIDYAYDGILLSFQGWTDAEDREINLAANIKQLNFKGFKNRHDAQHKEISWQVAQTDDHEAHATLSVPPGKSVILALSSDEVAIVSPHFVPFKQPQH
jgi:hypothetical protein